MTREEQIGVAVVAAAAVLALSVSTARGRAGSNRALGAVEGVTWSEEYPGGQQHLALPSEIGSVIWGPHPVYCGSQSPGRGRNGLINYGWQWLSDPPSEATI